MIIFKLSFLNSLTISFYLDIVYYISYILVSLLINISNLSIKKYIPNGIVILSCFKYFLSYLQFYLTGIKNAKSGNITDIFIESFFIR